MYCLGFILFHFRFCLLWVCQPCNYFIENDLLPWHFPVHFFLQSEVTLWISGSVNINSLGINTEFFLNHQFQSNSTRFKLVSVATIRIEKGSNGIMWSKNMFIQLTESLAFYFAWNWLVSGRWLLGRLCAVLGPRLLAAIGCCGGIIASGVGRVAGDWGMGSLFNQFWVLVIFLSFLLTCSTTYKVSCGKFIILESVLLYLWQINHVLTELLYCVLYYFWDHTKKSVFFSLGY